MKLINSEPQFEVLTKNDVIHVNLSGNWTVQADIAYLTTLTEHIHNVKGRPWSMIIDMRGWNLSLEVFNSEFKSKMFLDRRNQLAESWLVDDLNQSEILLTYFFVNSKLQPKRVLTMDDALNWIAQSQKNY